MNDRSSGYITELEYLRGYYADLSPPRIRLALLKAGLPVPEIATACELGFGLGDTIGIHATTSAVDWYGTDLNPAHVVRAQKLMQAAGTAIHLYQDNIVDFSARDDLPDFDFIGLNGVWSWVSSDVRLSIVEFVRKRLKVGGVLYMSYNTLPGWAPLMPLRELLVLHAKLAGKQDTPFLERVDDAIAFAENLLKVMPGYAADNPAVVARLARIRGEDKRYVAHEYFNQHFCPMDFPTVTSLLVPAQLTYAGSADIGNLESVRLSRSQRALLRGIDDRTYREFVRDLLVDQSLRRDYWVKGPLVPIEAGKRDILLRRTRVVAVTPRPDLHPKLQMALALNGSGLTEKIYRPILDLLADLAPITLDTIERALQSTGATLDQIFDAVLVIAGHEQLAPTLEPEATSALRERTRKLNALLLDASRSSDGLDCLASPLTGTGVPVARLHQLCLLARREGMATPEAWAAFAKEHPPRDTDKDWVQGTQIPAFVEKARLFAQNHLPLLKTLGIE